MRLAGCIRDNIGYGDPFIDELGCVDTLMREYIKQTRTKHKALIGTKLCQTRSTIRDLMPALSGAGDLRPGRMR